jgi:hypothetical protein
MPRFSSEIIKILEPFTPILGNDGYVPDYDNHLVPESFISSVAKNSGVNLDAIDRGFYNTFKILNRAPPIELHLVSIIPLGNPAVADNLWVVGLRATRPQINEFYETSKIFEMFPPAIKFNDLIARIGDQSLVKFFDSLPRENRTPYAATQPVGSQNG